MLRQLRGHDNIVRLIDVVELADAVVYVVMERIDGPGLDDFILQQRDAKLSEPSARRFFRHILAALRHAHARGFIHCDLKPANVRPKPSSADLNAWTNAEARASACDDLAHHLLVQKPPCPEAHLGAPLLSSLPGAPARRPCRRGYRRWLALRFGLGWQPSNGQRRPRRRRRRRRRGRHGGGSRGLGACTPDRCAACIPNGGDSAVREPGAAHWLQCGHRVGACEARASRRRMFLTPFERAPPMLALALALTLALTLTLYSGMVAWRHTL